MTDFKKFPFSLIECIEVTEKGNYLRVASDSFFTKKIYYHSASASNIEYLGYANPGNGISASAWAIKRYLYNSDGNPIDEQWSEGSLAMNRVIDDRTTYTYS